MKQDPPATPPSSRDVSAQVQRRIKIARALPASGIPFIILAGLFRKSTALLVLTPGILLIAASVYYVLFVLCRCPSCNAFLGFGQIPSHCPGCGTRVGHTPEK